MIRRKVVIYRRWVRARSTGSEAIQGMGKEEKPLKNVARGGIEPPTSGL